VEALRGKLLSQEIGASFFETSALNGSGVQEAFDSVIQSVGETMMKQDPASPLPLTSLEIDEENIGHGRPGCCFANWGRRCVQRNKKDDNNRVLSDVGRSRRRSQSDGVVRRSRSDRDARHR